MRIFKQRLRWYYIKFAKFRYRVAYGDGLKSFFQSKFDSFLKYFTALGAGEIAINKWFDISMLDYIPWWVMIVVPLIDTVSDYYFGEFAEKRKLMQIEAELMRRREIDPWEKEKMDRLIDIQRRVAPDTLSKKYKTYVRGETGYDSGDETP